MGYTSEPRESLPTKLWVMVTPDSMAGAFLHGMFEGWKS